MSGPSSAFARRLIELSKDSKFGNALFQLKTPIWDPQYRFFERSEAYKRIGKEGWAKYMRSTWADVGKHPKYPYPVWDDYFRSVLANVHYLVMGASLGFIVGQLHYDYKAIREGKITHPLARPKYDWDEITHEASKLTMEDVAHHH